VIDNRPITGGWARHAERYTPPAGARYAAPVLYNYVQSTAQQIYVDEVSLRRGIGATVIQDGAIVTAHMTANTISGDRIETGTLNANKIQASTVISGSVLVGNIGYSLGTVEAWANDPISRANAVYVTKIDPGVVQISGGTLLWHWRFGGDSTKIEGGNIGANSITANKMTIGNRGIGVVGCAMWCDKTNGNVFWNEGYIFYTDDFGNETSQYIGTSSHATGGAWTYFVWVKGTGGFTATTAAPTNPNWVVVATYAGYNVLNVNYGNTIIDGDRILTNTISANRITAGSITTVQLAASNIISAYAQINNAIILNGHIVDLQVDNLKVGNNAVSTQNYVSADTTPGISGAHYCRAGSRMLIQGDVVASGSTWYYVAYANRTIRSYWLGVNGTPYINSFSFDFCCGSHYFGGSQYNFDWMPNICTGDLFWYTASEGTWTFNWQTYDNPYYMLYGMMITELDK
jgi:hypothetical protein